MAGRMGTNQHTESPCNTLQTLEKGNSRDIAAAAVGMSGEQAARWGFLLSEWWRWEDLICDKGVIKM